MQRNLLKVAHLPMSIKQIQFSYLINPHFKDIYEYVAQNKLTNSKVTILQVGTFA